MFLKDNLLPCSLRGKKKFHCQAHEAKKVSCSTDLSYGNKKLSIPTITFYLRIWIIGVYFMIISLYIKY